MTITKSYHYIYELNCDDDQHIWNDVTESKCTMKKKKNSAIWMNDNNDKMMKMK